MKRYSSYKDSGVEWIGEIPRHWDVKKLKYFGSVILGKMLCNEDKGGYSLKLYLRSVNIQSEVVDVSDVKEMWFSENEMDKYRLKKGDLLFNEGGDVGRTCLWNEELEECYIQNSVNMVRVDCSERYILYNSILHHQLGYYNSVVDRVSIPHLTKEKLEIIPFIYPPLHEQQHIVSYLDEKTSIIDTLIQSKQKKITLLKEKRTSLINHIVTKGLNPNVEMKDSGVEWIGEIPIGWELSRIKHLFTEKKSTPNPSLSSGSISFGEVVYKDDESILETTKESYQEVLKGEFLINPLNLNYDLKSLRIGLSKIDVVVSQGYIVLLIEKHQVPEYYKFLLYIFDIKHLKSLGQGVRQTISFTHLKNEQLPLPPLNEQQQIVQFLDEETSLIDKTISIEERKIELLKEYRQSLISDVVTGKICVLEDG